VSEFGWLRCWSGRWHKAKAEVDLTDPSWQRLAGAICGTTPYYDWVLFQLERPPEAEICKRCLAAEEREGRE